MITSIKIHTILLLSVHISNQNIQLRVMLCSNQRPAVQQKKCTVSYRVPLRSDFIPYRLKKNFYRTVPYRLIPRMPRKFYRPNLKLHTYLVFYFTRSLVSILSILTIFLPESDVFSESKVLGKFPMALIRSYQVSSLFLLLQNLGIFSLTREPPEV